jgi:hypothetical protein
MTSIESSELMKTAAATLRTLSAENVQLTEKLARYEQREQAEEVVALMDRRGMFDPQVPHQEKVASVLSSGKDLRVMREALAMTAANMSFAKVASISAPSSNPLDRLESYLTVGDENARDY